MIYYLILLVLALFSFMEVLITDTDRKVGNIWLTFIGVFLVLMAGFRTVGVDMEEYKETFSQSSNVGGLIDYGVEPVFAYLNHFVKIAGFPVHILFLLIASLGVGLKLYFIKKFSPYVFPGLVIYFSTLFLIKEMGQIRHGISMAFVLVSFGMMMEQRYKVGWLMLLLAILFHYSAICCAPAYFFIRGKIGIRWIIGILIAIFPLLLIDLKPIYIKIVQAVPIASMQSKGIAYINSPLYGVRTGINSSIILRLIVIGVMIYYKDRLSEKMPHYYPLLNLYFLGICYFILFSSVDEFSGRTSIFYRSLELVILPSFILLGRSLGDKLLITFVIALNGFNSLRGLLEADFAVGVYDGYDNVLLQWLSDMIHNS